MHEPTYTPPFVSTAHVSAGQPIASGSSRRRPRTRNDGDVEMRDVGDNPGGRKLTVRSSTTIRTQSVYFQSHIGRYTESHTMQRGTRTMSSSASRRDDRPRDFDIRGKLSREGRITWNEGPGTGSTSSPRIRRRNNKTELWREVVQSRWNPEMQFLNLECLIEDELVKKHQLYPPGHGGTVHDAKVIFKLAGELKPEIQTLSLANNNLSGHLLGRLSKYLPRLVNLSLHKNGINKEDIKMIFSRGRKLTHLRELILIDNPIYDQAYNMGSGDVYRNEVARRIPSLEMLDQHPIARISFDEPHCDPSSSSTPVEKPSATTFPFEMGPSFITGVDGSIVSNFLVRFFHLLDSNRQALASAYESEATFSFLVNTSIPARSRVAGLASQRVNWKPWVEKGSRNLRQIGEDPTKTLYIGGDQIAQVLCSLPGTRHDISGGAEKFSLDAFPIPQGQSMGLLLIVHGQLTETGSGGVRSFDRTFILAPAAEGSRAKESGWDVAIISDQWNIRDYSSHEAWQPGPLQVQASVGNSKKPEDARLPYTADQVAALASLPEDRRNLVIKVSAETGLNLAFGADCLNANDWDFGRAVVRFKEVRNSLPKEAF